MPIPGLRSPEQVDQTAAALSWMLSTAERDRLDALVLAGDAARMPANPFQSA
jgi:aryl-alcohol dehydrogenase-like predicted oxidoreductase